MVLENELVDSKAAIHTGGLYGEIVLCFIGIFDEECCLREHKLGADFRSVRLLVRELRAKDLWPSRQPSFAKHFNFRYVAGLI
jgi:hypothetical protein